MNFVISIINQNGLTMLSKICADLSLPVVMTMRGRGTADESVLDLLGIEDNEKRVIFTVADEQRTKKLIEAEKKYLYIDAPGNGIVVVLPIKSVGGVQTLSYLYGGQVTMKTPTQKFDYELIMAIANDGYTDMVMDAARSAGARGGTVLHAKGTGADNAEMFFKVNIAQEKEIILIVAESAQKTAIMKAILEQAGVATPAGALVCSLPVSDFQGFRTVTEE